MRHPQLILEMKERGHGLMSVGQYMAVAEIVELSSPCNFLVFGLGHDAYLWREINSGGRTAFLEDDKEWIGKFSESGLEIYAVEYDTRAEDYEKYGYDKEKLKMDLPKEITETNWDIIFVDGPLGHNPPRPFKGPGRMKSISAAHDLLKPNGICIFDDMGRMIERNYSLHFFGQDNLRNIVEGKIGIFQKEGGK